MCQIANQLTVSMVITLTFLFFIGVWPSHKVCVIVSSPLRRDRFVVVGADLGLLDSLLSIFRFPISPTPCPAAEAEGLHHRMASSKSPTKTKKATTKTGSAKKAADKPKAAAKSKKVAKKGKDGKVSSLPLFILLHSHFTINPPHPPTRHLPPHPLRRRSRGQPLPTTTSALR